MKPKGFTLVELMVGLGIASLCTIMMLMLFKQSSQISINSAEDAQYEAQLQTALLVSQRFIQNAGYGSGSSNDIELGQHFNNPALFWRYIPNLNATPVTYICQGLAEEIQQKNGRVVHRLVLIEKTACGNTTAISAGTWQESKAIVAIKHQDQQPIFKFSLGSSDCTPFGIDNDKAGTKQVTLSAERPHLQGAVGSTLQSSICLSNIKMT